MKKRKWAVRLGVFSYESESDEPLNRPLAELGRQPLYDRLSEIETKFTAAVSVGDDHGTASELMRLVSEFGNHSARFRAANIARQLEECASEPGPDRTQRRGELFDSATTLADDVCKAMLVRLRTAREASNSPVATVGRAPTSSAVSRLRRGAVVYAANASFGFPDREVVSKVQLSVHTGEVVAFVGGNGEGKSTLLKGLAGNIKPITGRVEYPALEAEYKNRNAVLNQVVLVEQVPKTWPGTVETALRAYGALRGVSRTANADQVAFFIEYMGLWRYRHYHYSELSAGYKTRFELAKAMIVDTRLLLLDEPLGPLDPGARGLYLRRLRDLADSLTSPAAVVVTAVDPLHIVPIADRVFTVGGGALHEWTGSPAGNDSLTYELAVAGSRPSPERLEQVLTGLRPSPTSRVAVVRAARRAPVGG